MVKFMKEDLLYIRQVMSEDGMEITPDELIRLIKECTPDTVVVDEPGLVSFMKELREREE